jgi:hypothetical protein
MECASVLGGFMDHGGATYSNFQQPTPVLWNFYNWKKKLQLAYGYDKPNRLSANGKAGLLTL